MSSKHLYWIVLLTILFEGITCIFRFGLDLVSTRDTVMIARYTFGFRLHHGYIGLIIAAAGTIWLDKGHLQNLMIRIGWALVVSDLVHHFFVLWPIFGDPQFDIRYP